MKILIINQPFGNRGDEAAHRAMMHAFLKRLSDAEFIILTYGKLSREKYETCMVNDERVQYVFISPGIGFTALYMFILRHRLPLWLNFHPTQKKIIKYYKDADLIVCAPGGICMGGFMNWRHLYFLHIAKYYKKPLAYYGRSFGPFSKETREKELFKIYAEEIIHYFSYIGIRDNKSETVADEMGIKYVPSIDTAFLENPKTKVPRFDFLQQKYMVFVPNQLTWHYAYNQYDIQEVVNAFYLDVMRVIREKYPTIQIVMLPQLMGEGGDGDFAYMCDLATKMNDDKIVVIPRNYPSDTQQAIIKGAEFVIGGRYHSIVFAINQERPFIALNYEFKIAGLLAKLGYSDRMVNIENIWNSSRDIHNTIISISGKLDDLFSSKKISRNLASDIANNALDIFVEWSHRNVNN